MRSVARTAALLLAAGTAALALSACGHKEPTPVGQRLQREDLALASRELQRVQAPVEREVAAAKAAWPLIVRGLPARVQPLSAPVQAANAAAAAVPLPPLFSERVAAQLTGPASGIAGLYRTYQGLMTRGWRLIGAAIAQIEHGAPAAASFARANVAIYIESVYDAHFGLGQIGKKITDGYGKLKGPGAFGATLTQAEVQALTSFYSEANDRLQPHVGIRLGS